MLRRHSTTVWTAAVALFGALGLAACGGSSNTAVTGGAATGQSTTGAPPPTAATTTTTGADTGTATAATGTSTATQSTPSSTDTATGTMTSAGVGAGACTAADLTPSFLGGNGATGTVVLSFALTNRTTHSCRTYGWPGVEFLGSGGQALGTDSRRTTSDALGATPPAELTLAPGKEASFRIITADQGAGGGSAGCVTAAEVQIIAPDDTATMRVSLSNGPITACGSTTVSPLLAGDSAQPGA